MAKLQDCKLPHKRGFARGFFRSPETWQNCKSSCKYDYTFLVNKDRNYSTVQVESRRIRIAWSQRWFCTSPMWIVFWFLLSMLISLYVGNSNSCALWILTFIGNGPIIWTETVTCSKKNWRVPFVGHSTNLVCGSVFFYSHYYSCTVICPPN